MGTWFIHFDSLKNYLSACIIAVARNWGIGIDNILRSRICVGPFTEQKYDHMLLACYILGTKIFLRKKKFEYDKGRIQEIMANEDAICLPSKPTKMKGLAEPSVIELQSLRQNASLPRRM